LHSRRARSAGLRQIKEIDMVVWARTTRSWDPWLEMNALLDGLAGRAEGRWPQIRARSDEKSVHLRALIPGFAIEDLELSVRGQELTLRGKRKQVAAHEVAEFERSMKLPFPVEAEKVKAVAKDGVLDVELPRAAAEAPRRIPVRSE
jgi:HSP20 family protein